MKHHWHYLKYVLRHKWYVLVAGRRLGAPLFSLVFHDWTKFLYNCEWCPYVWSFYQYNTELGRPQWVKDDFDKAWLHHQKRNKHHWQYWVLIEDSGVVKPLEMPVPYVREMVADWCGAGRAITGEWDVATWYHKNRDRIQLHRYTRIHVEELIKIATREFS